MRPHRRSLRIGASTREAALQALAAIPISVHCWQGDDVVGFAKPGAAVRAAASRRPGNYPGRARNPAELRADLEFAYSRIPGTHRLNLHAFYMDTEESPDRDEIEYKHFTRWVDWAKQIGIGVGLQPDLFCPRKSRRQSDAFSSRQGRPRFLDRTRQAHPARSRRGSARRSDRRRSTISGCRTGPRTSPSTAWRRGSGSKTALDEMIAQKTRQGAYARRRRVQSCSASVWKR